MFKAASCVVLCVPLSDVAGAALALTADVVAQPGVTTRALLRAVDAEGAEGARLGADRTLGGHRTHGTE